MLVDLVRQRLAVATKGGDEVTVQTLRMLMAALEYRRGQKMEAFGEADETAVVKSEVKKRQEAVAIYTKVNQAQRAVREQKELEVLSQYLPTMASEEEIKKVVEEFRPRADQPLAEKGIKRGQPAESAGRLIGMVINKVGKDRADGSLVARIVNEVLNVSQ